MISIQKIARAKKKEKKKKTAPTNFKEYQNLDSSRQFTQQFNFNVKGCFVQYSAFIKIKNTFMSMDECTIVTKTGDIVVCFVVEVQDRI